MGNVEADGAIKEIVFKFKDGTELVMRNFWETNITTIFPTHEVWMLGREPETIATGANYCEVSFKCDTDSMLHRAEKTRKKLPKLTRILRPKGE